MSTLFADALAKSKSISERLLKAFSIVLVVSGVVLIFIGIVIQLTHGPHRGEDFHWYELFNHLFESLGVALIAIGGLNITLEVADWRDRIVSILKDIVITKDFIANLDVETLGDIEKNVLIGFNGGKDDCVESDRAYWHYVKTIRSDLLSSFRYNVNVKIDCDESSSYHDAIDVVNELSFWVRKVGESVESEVVFGIDKDEFLKLNLAEIRIRTPEGCDIPDEYKDKATSEIKPLFSSTEKYAGKDEEFFNDALKIIRIPIPKWARVDGLMIFQTVIYTIDVEKLQFVSMARPTRGYTLTINFDPKKFFIDCKEFVSKHRGKPGSGGENGRYQAINPAWMLPSHAVAWRLIPKGRQPIAYSGVNTGAHPQK